MMATLPQSSLLEPADDTPPDKNGAASVDLRSPETVMRLAVSGVSIRPGCPSCACCCEGWIAKAGACRERAGTSMNGAKGSRSIARPDLCAVTVLSVLRTIACGEAHRPRDR